MTWEVMRGPPENIRFFRALADLRAIRVPRDMSTPNLDNQRIVVVGASRGLGRGIATALDRAGAHVTAIARDRAALESLTQESGVMAKPGDATDASLAEAIIRDERPDAVVMVAGTTPALGPLSEYDWDDLCEPWLVDVQAAFRWIQAALRVPMKPGSRIVVFSSGAALHGSPISGGYAGAKQTQRFLVQYAAAEASGRSLGLGFHAILPQLNPNTDLGRAAIAAYAKRTGETPEAFVDKRFGPQPLDPTIAGNAMVELLGSDALVGTPEFLLTGTGLQALGKPS